MLTSLQQRLVRLIGALPEARGFALAGGAALITRGVVERHTHDLDFFATRGEPVAVLADAVEDAVEAAGLECRRIRAVDGFVRLEISDRAETSEVDLSYDARVRPVERVGVVDVLAIEELAADKTLAVFGRAAARDFVDLAALGDRFGLERLLVDRRCRLIACRWQRETYADCLWKSHARGPKKDGDTEAHRPGTGTRGLSRCFISRMIRVLNGRFWRLRQVRRTARIFTRPSEPCIRWLSVMPLTAAAL